MDDYLLELLENKVRIHELSKLLRDLGERPGGAVCCERMDGARDARHEVRVLIRNKIKRLKGE